MYIFNNTDPQERLQQLIDIREDLNNRLSVLSFNRLFFEGV
jgi:hypothetical protein